MFAKKGLTGCSKNDGVFCVGTEIKSFDPFFVMGKFCDANLAAKIDASRGCASEI
jgi:hypothetical protein